MEQVESNSGFTALSNAACVGAGPGLGAVFDDSAASSKPAAHITVTQTPVLIVLGKTLRSLLRIRVVPYI
jgi:hypothetical protein